MVFRDKPRLLSFARAAITGVYAMRKAARCAVAFFMILLAGEAGLAGEPANINPLNLPADINVFIGHKARCKSFANRDGLNCEELSSEEATLRERYQSDARLLGLIGGDWTIVIRRVPVHVPPLQILPDGTLVPDIGAPEP